MCPNAAGLMSDFTRLDGANIGKTEEKTMSAPFTETTSAFKKGVDNIPPAAASTLIDDWAASLKDNDAPGAKEIVHDLHALKKALHADKPDAAAIKKLVSKLGEETTKIAGHATASTKDHVAALGKTLSSL